jgi:hypothetical protein
MSFELKDNGSEIQTSIWIYNYFVKHQLNTFFFKKNVVLDWNVRQLQVNA